MKVKVQFEMPLPEGFEPFLKVIAETHGYVESTDGGPSMNDFICKEICEKQVSSLFRNLIVNALTPYFGIAGREQVQAVEDSYMAMHSVVADIVSE